MLMCFMLNSLQVQERLPHLKAIIQYKDELKEKKPNVYTVNKHAAWPSNEICAATCFNLVHTTFFGV